MVLDANYKPEFSSYRDILLEMAQQRSVDLLLERLVQRITQRPHIALTSVWLKQEGDICDECTMKGQCPDRSKCLHLVTHSTNFIKTTPEEWSGWSSLFRRIPLGIFEIGRVASTGNAGALLGIKRHPEWLERHPWAIQEGVIDFGALPLRAKDDVFGVIAFYSRISLDRPDREAMIWLRLVTTHAAISIANARAFEQIELLKHRLELENTYLREELDDINPFGDLIGKSPAILNVMKQIELVAPTDATVLILGDSGTGKELVAREIHKRSLRGDKPLIKVNCASIPKELYESEFFGHIKGSFTGAFKDRSGRFEAAHGGTLFLDEVGEIPSDLQSKLLRVLQDGQYERVGEDKPRNADVRLICATNRDLIREAEAGRFRQDLYYRLNVFPIKIPPLRQRKEDISLLANHFLKTKSAKMNRPDLRLTRANLLLLENYTWPGNVRELQNVIERAIITSKSGVLVFDLPSSPDPESSGKQKNIQSTVDDENIVPEIEMRRREQQNIIAALKKAKWKIYGHDGAAELLGIKPTTLRARIKKLQINKPGPF